MTNQWQASGPKHADGDVLLRTLQRGWRPWSGSQIIRSIPDCACCFGLVPKAQKGFDHFHGPLAEGAGGSESDSVIDPLSSIGARDDVCSRKMKLGMGRLKFRESWQSCMGTAMPPDPASKLADVVSSDLCRAYRSIGIANVVPEARFPVGVRPNSIIIVHRRASTSG